MRIAVNARLLVKDKFCGISWFTYEALKRITREHPEHEFLLLFDRPYSEEFRFGSNVVPVVIGLPTRHPLLWRWWISVAMPRALRKYKPDLFFSPDGFMPIACDIPSLNVIHDVGFEHVKENLPSWPRQFYRRYIPSFARNATRIATVSHFSKGEISRTYGIPSDKIDVVHDGVNEIFVPLSEQEKDEVRRKYGAGTHYFIAVGRLHVRKNMHQLLRAFDAFKSSTPSPMKLVVVGSRRWGSGEVKTAFDSMRHRTDVVFTGRVPDDELSRLMGAADALVFLPMYEGFGLALVEAMRCEIPIVTIATTSIPEVAGDAALYVDATSIDSIREGMTRIAQDEELRLELISRGRKQRSHFSWDHTAKELWRSMERSLSA
jgi:glycosyltransferase involved in cell wall biosynthesis